MKPSLVTPVCIALALHVALLFGFDSHADPSNSDGGLVNEGFCTLPLVPMPPIEDEAVVVDAVVKEESESSTDQVSDLAPQADTTASDMPKPSGMQITSLVPPIDGGAIVVPGSLIGSIGGPSRITGDGIVGLDGLDQLPRATLQVPPQYPHAKRREGTEGSIAVTFVVDRAGKVVTAQTADDVDREFAEAALAAVRRWRFEPGKKDGRPVSFRMTVPIVFSITNA